MSALWPKALFVLAFAAVLLGGADGLSFGGGARAEAVPRVVPGRYIVAFAEQADPQAYAELLGLRIDKSYGRALRGFAARIPSDTVARLREDPNVLSVEPDRAVRLADEFVPTGIDRIEGEPAGDINASGPDLDIDVAVIDTGVDLDHPDLQVAGGYASYSEQIFIWLFCGFTDAFDDAHGHGTHVSGTIAARDNSIGVVGAAPGARIWAVRVVGASGFACLSDVIAGIDWITANADTIEVANMSLGGFGDSPALCAAISGSVAAGVTYAVAAGNELLLSFAAAGTVPGVGNVDDSDIVKFTPSSLGEITAGRFELYFDGSDVGLTRNAEDIDALELSPDGHILLSTRGKFAANGLSARDEDILEFTPATLGAGTSGAWSLYFDGSDVALSSSGEDVDGLALAGDDIYLSVRGNFSVTGVSGADENVFVFTPSSLAPATSGSFDPALFFAGDLFGLSSNDVSAIDLP